MRRLAWVNVAMHGIGLVLALVFLRPGTASISIESRMSYLAGSPIGWILTWLVWVSCIGLMIGFTRLVAKRLGPNIWTRAAVFTAFAAGAFDLVGDGLFIFGLPSVARAGESEFLALEQFTRVISLTCANGLYSLATLFLAVALRPVSRLCFILGSIVCFFGMVLAATAFTHEAWHAEAATGPTIGLYCVWVILVARLWK